MSKFEAFRRVGLDSEKRILGKRCEKSVNRGKRWKKRLLGTGKEQMI